MTRPILLFACHPLTGHVTPVLRIAAGLRQRGWQVAFLSSAFFQARIEAADLQFLPLQGAADLDDAKLFDRASVLPAPLAALGFAPDTLARLPQSITDLRHQTLAALPDEWRSIQGALATLAGQNPGRRLLLVSEAFFYGAMPFHFGGAALLPDAAAVVPRTVCISITAPAIRSVDMPPFGSLAPFDTSAAGRQKNAQAWDAWRDRVQPLTALIQQMMAEAGAVDPPAQEGGGVAIRDIVFLGGTNYTCHDAIAQVGIPAFEIPRTDFPPGFRIVGIVPPVIPPASSIRFPWWPEITANAQRSGAGRKKVVVVAQGTVETEPTELILPTLRLLGGRDDVITVAILGVRGADLSRVSPPLPANARVADYLSYDAVLQYADLWVQNGGYGATMHGIAHGVPMVIAGDGQDKPENGKRVQYSGLGIDLQTARPAADKLREAIDTVLAEPQYTAVAKSMQKTFEAMDCFANVEAMILEQADR